MKRYMNENRIRLLAVLALFGAVLLGMDPALAMGAGMLLTTTSGQLGNGTVLSVSAGSPTTYSVVGNARNIEFDNGSSAKVDMTNLTSDWKEFLLGLPDPGSLTFTIDLNLGDAGHAALRAARVNRTKCDFKVVLFSGTTPTALMQGFVCKFPVTLGVDAPVQTQCEAYLTGPVTFN
jgi:hypothetical protein